MSRKVKILIISIISILIIFGVVKLCMNIYSQYFHASNFWGTWVSENGKSTFTCSYDEKTEIASYTLTIGSANDIENKKWGFIYRVEDESVLFIDQSDEKIGGVENQYDYEITGDQLRLNGCGIDITFFKQK